MQEVRGFKGLSWIGNGVRLFLLCQTANGEPFGTWERNRLRITLRNLNCSSRGILILTRKVRPTHRSQLGFRDVLIAFPSSATNRLLRESFENFTHSRVETTTDAVRAFEMALQKPYRVFLFAYEFEQMEGTLLYELICKVYSTGGGPKKIAPGVIFIRENKDVTVSEDWIRDARVKDIISKPIRIDRLLRAVRGILEIHDPTSGE